MFGYRVKMSENEPFKRTKNIIYIYIHTFVLLICTFLLMLLCMLYIYKYMCFTYLYSVYIFFR